METTARFGWPLLAPGQAQKEMTHNEALALVDLAVSPLIEDVAGTPPATPAVGQAWIVGAGAGGAWAGRAVAIAGWTAGGWRFLMPAAGMVATRRHDGASLRFDGTAWRDPIGVADPSGGAVIDSEARAAITAVLALLREAGWVERSG